MRKCPKCGWEVNETDTDMWSAWDCSNPECGFGGFIDLISIERRNVLSF